MFGTVGSTASGETIGASKANRVVYPRGRQPRLALPDGSSRAIESLLRIDQPMRFGDFLWSDTGGAGPVWVRIDLAHQLISVFRGGNEIGTALILFGTDGKPTPAGMFPVLSKTKLHRSTNYDADMPFSVWLTRSGVAIHASPVRYGAATHGCIGVPPGFAEQLFGAIAPGDLVAILPDRDASRTTK
jgi:hypothetical protein